MSMHLAFFRSPDDPDLNKKLDAAYALQAAGVKPPWPPLLEAFVHPIIHEYGEMPKDRRQAIDRLLRAGPSWDGQKVYAWRGDSSEGFEVDLTLLPPDVTKIRFYCSW